MLREEQKSLQILNIAEVIREKRNKKRTFARSVHKVGEYIVANDFDLLLTVTLDPRYLRNYTPDGARRRMQTWLFTQSMKSRAAGNELRYIVFPDISQGKHLLEFHILLSGYVFSLKRSGIVIDGQLAYTVKSFKAGFTKARSLSGSSKQEIFDLVLPFLENNAYNLFNGRRYWPSRSLDEIEAFENSVTRLQASYDLDAINALGVIESSE